MTPVPIQYPVVTIGGKLYQLRFAHSAWFLLQQWGYQIGDPNKPIPIAALAAAAAGEVDASGKWHSAGFARVVDFTDAMQEGETLASLDEPVLIALKKAAPQSQLTLTEQRGESLN
jgi:hypothetical protein